MTKIWTSESGLLLMAPNNYKVVLNIQSPNNATNTWEFRGDVFTNLTELVYNKDFPYTAAEYVANFYSTAASVIKNRLENEFEQYIINQRSRSTYNPYYSPSVFDLDFSSLERLSLSELRALVCSLSNLYDETIYGTAYEVVEYAAYREGVCFYCPTISVSATGYWSKFFTPGALTNETITTSLDLEVTFRLNTYTSEPLIPASDLQVSFSVLDMPANSVPSIQLDSRAIKFPSGSSVNTTIKFNVFDSTSYTNTFSSITQDTTINATIDPNSVWTSVGEISTSATSMFPVIPDLPDYTNPIMLPDSVGNSTTYYELGQTAASSTSYTANGQKILRIYDDDIFGISIRKEIAIERSGKTITVSIRYGSYKLTQIIEEEDFTSDIHLVNITTSYLYRGSANSGIMVLNIVSKNSSQSNYHCLFIYINQSAGSAATEFEVKLFHASDFGVESSFLASSTMSGIVIPLYENGEYYLKGDFGDGSNTWWYKNGLLHAYWKLDMTNSSITKILEIPASSFYRYDRDRQYAAIYINNHSYFVKPSTAGTSYLCYLDTTTPQIVNDLSLSSNTFSTSALINPYSDVIYGQGASSSDSRACPFYSNGQATDWFTSGSCLKYRYGITPTMGLAFDSTYAYLFLPRANNVIKVYRKTLSTFFSEYLPGPVTPTIIYAAANSNS